MNERDEWELTGERIEHGESPEKCVKRERHEELRLSVAVDELLDTYLFEVVPGKYVFIVTYGCSLKSMFTPIISDEHKKFGLFSPDRLPSNFPQDYCSSIAAWRSKRQALPATRPALFLWRDYHSSYMDPVF